MSAGAEPLKKGTGAAQIELAAKDFSKLILNEHNVQSTPPS
jgi:hypothetical protein